MPSFAADTVFHGALTPLAVDQVALKGATGTRVKIINRDTSLPIYYRFDGVDPIVGGNESYVIPAGAVDSFSPMVLPVEVRLISSGAAVYSVSSMA